MQTTSSTVTKSTELTLSNNPFTREMPSLFGGLGKLYATGRMLNAPDIDYDMLNLKADSRDIQAEELKLQTIQDANALRREFIKAEGSYIAGTARRGVRAGEGSAGQNLEASARDIGTDIQTMQGNTDYQVKQLNADAERIRKAATGARDINKMERDAKFAGAVGDMLGVAGTISKDFDKSFSQQEKTKKTEVNKATAKKLKGGVKPKKQESNLKTKSTGRY